MNNFDKLYALADALADVQLAGKVDKQGKPLIEHCRRVAEECKRQGLSHEQQIAALLHDVLENGLLEHTDSSNPILAALFGDQVARYVFYLTRAEDETYQHYISIISNFKDIIPIKIADLQDNLDARRGPIPDSLKARYEEALIKLTQAWDRKEKAE
jgi:(p)ppGpp synthase/HD superfamily hydrolase